MLDFDEWCDEEEKAVNGHDLSLLTTDEDGAELGIEKLAATVPEHFVSKRRYAHILKLLGKPRAANYLEEKLPTTKSIKSSDLGEILATSYIEEATIG